MTEYDFSETGTGPFSRAVDLIRLATARQNSTVNQRGRPAAIARNHFRRALLSLTAGVEG
ncbi:MAG: hypothetical protein MZV63_42260 [Marinilabiliales bacterium]|nr:hypothetical protein [Marinilabiliales bacterium]